MPAGDFPIVEILEFDTAEVADPVGTRHIAGGSFAFKQKISLGCSSSDLGSPGTTSGVLVFEDIKFNISSPNSHITSKVAAIVFRLAASGTGIGNMRLYLADNTALTAGQFHEASEPIRLQFSSSGVWQPNCTLPSGITAFMGNVVPSMPNVFRQDGQPSLVANDDTNVSQYVYMNLVVPFGAPLGTFGVCGSGLLRLGLIFDYFDNSYLL